MSDQERSRVSLQAYPARDATFARDLDEVVELVTANSRFDDGTVADLEAAVQARLRSRYPNAIVHAQDPFARLRDPEVTLYAYRDGRIRADDPHRERLYRALADARTTCSESRRLVDKSETTGSIWSGVERKRHPLEDPDEGEELSPSRPRPHPEGNALPDQ